MERLENVEKNLKQATSSTFDGLAAQQDTRLRDFQFKMLVELRELRSVMNEEKNKMPVMQSSETKQVRFRFQAH